MLPEILVPHLPVQPTLLSLSLKRNTHTTHIKIKENKESPHKMLPYFIYRVYIT